MAKAKSTNSPKRQPAAPAKRKSAASTNGRSPSTTEKSPDKTQRSFSHEEIGHTAGELWSYLSNNSAQTLAAIRKSIDASPDLILAALGWLAREDKLEFSNSGRTLKVSLR